MPGATPEQSRHQHDERLERIESEVGFVSHTSDKLGQQVLSLHKAIDALSARLARLESRVDAIHAPASHGSEDGSSPHAESLGAAGNEPGDSTPTERDDRLGERPPHWGRTPGRD